ncbi:hypothetical protein JZ751_025903 [Albula glossodonta]|uniref:DNA cross-link repair 1A protein n=1 Tax=Albula glossodonta TaxID=121402 RepID=A0A8T2NF05_9TELE|nr:hypothetical protein JZ751_025903 [Albula glossodonta]
MSQTDSESDIWEYKSLRKLKKQDAHTSNKRGSKNKSATVSSGSMSLQKTSRINKRLNKKEPKAEPGTGCKPEEVHKKSSHYDKHVGALPPNATAIEDGNLATIRTSSEKEISPDDKEKFCPSCQMPFSLLLVQSQRWHVSECLDTLGEDREECPDGIKCSSTIPNHYRKYSHFLLAHSRATNDKASLSPDSSQESLANVSTPSSHSPSPSPSTEGPGQNPTHKRTNAFLLLKSPALEDIKKKKGWSPISKGRKTGSAEQRGGATQSPAKAGVSSGTSWERPLKVELFPFPSPALAEPSLIPTLAASSPSQPLAELSPPPSPCDSDKISYSPISAPPICDETPPSCRSLSYSGMANGEDEDRDSMVLYSDDEQLAELLIQTETESSSQPGHITAAVTSSPSIAPGSDELNEHPAGVAEMAATVSPIRGLKGDPAAGGCGTEHPPANDSRLELQSPQSVVLERLRDHLSSAGERYCVDLGAVDAASGCVKQEGAVLEPFPSPTQRSSHQALANMAPRKAQGKAAASCGLKQMDIGVFFGLKPKAEDCSAKENLPQALPAVGSLVGAQANGIRRQRKRKASSSNGEPIVLGVTDGCTNKSSPAEGNRGGMGRKRWRRRTEDGLEQPRPCPFYKKIPGTRFVVDAFQYGVVEGISAYFLTHFHSDHYSGLNKRFSMPVYCNKITGNLVKTKLRVDEKYIHVLPMNTECTVEGVRVTLLDANHCPGAAMLLFVLPDGQTVLHTGDFRANPSMERYPELLGCRVQTLYCSPEYTFPSQQEVVTFAVNTAFERVTLNPRTLVVCGTYSVGKEKVFLAMAEVLGCKVSLSRDKFVTMCCLESERIQQLITTDWKAAQIHVLSMMQINFKSLQAHLGKFSAKYDQVLAFKPTGWTYSDQTETVEDIRPQVQGNVTIYGIPYSEHSSYLEMKRFVQWLRPLKIIPTVNVGSRASRRAMETCFSEWQAESTG